MNMNFPKFRPIRRRGSTAVMAMMFLLLFASLAIGFYASVATSVQVAGNEQRTGRSMLAAESGMQFMKYHLATLDLPARTPPAELFTKVYESLSAKLDNYPNMPAASRTIAINADEDFITIPGNVNEWIALDDDGSAFRCTIEKKLAGEEIEVRVYGRWGDATQAGGRRALKLDYANFPNPASIFNYGVVSKSRITMNGNVTIKGTVGNDHMGSVMSAYTAGPVPLVMIGRPEISGHVSFVNADAMPSIDSNATIAGLHPGEPGFADVVHKGVPEPEFPLVDTSAFLPFAPPATATSGSQVITSSTVGGNYFKNIRIKAGANPTFNNNTTIQGVIVVESPNYVKFNGGAKIQGVIVVETDDNNNAHLDPSKNIIEFKGGVNFTGVETLPATSDFPEALRKLTGAMMLAPGFKGVFGGNFNTVSGSIVASQLSFSGTAGGTVKGSVINLADTAVELSGTSDIIIESQGTSNHPAGLLFGSHYSALPHTYEEVRE